jgi:hypothetical protein
LDSTRNIIVLTADRRVFELPTEFSDRLYARLDLEFGGSIGSRQSIKTNRANDDG